MWNLTERLPVVLSSSLSSVRAGRLLEAAGEYIPSTTNPSSLSNTTAGRTIFLVETR
jgi:hypothetical protein